MNDREKQIVRKENIPYVRVWSSGRVCDGMMKKIICVVLSLSLCLALCGCTDGNEQYDKGYKEGRSVGYEEGYDDGRNEYEMKYDDLYAKYDDLKYNYDEYRQLVKDLAQAYANVGEDELADILTDFVLEH